jgi:arylsulfatase A-like enzyme
MRMDTAGRRAQRSRTGARRLAALGLGLLAAAVGCGSGAGRAESRPDVVVFVIDTLRRDRLGVYGYPRPTSPHIDALAGESFVFDNAYAPGPWTLPSVVSLLTAAPPVDHGVVDPGDSPPAELPTLPSALGALGYRTAAFSANPLLHHGLLDGFDRVERLDRHLRTGPVEHWLDEVGDAPFLLYVQSTEPHEPYEPPEEHLTAVAGGADAVDPELRRKITRITWDWRRRRDADEVVARLTPHAGALDLLYDATVAWADSRVGKLIGLLQRRGRWEDTVFVVTSDHGEELFDHGSLFHGHTLYGELVHIPLVWRFPGREAAGARVSAPASLVDLLPTLLDYLGEPERAAACRGRSLLPALRRDAAADARARVTSFRIGRGGRRPVKASGERGLVVVDGRWKGIWLQDEDRFVLFDLERDPTEQRDVASRHPRVTARLRAEAERFMEGRTWPLVGPPDAEDWELAPGMREALEELGYVR